MTLALANPRFDFSHGVLSESSPSVSWTSLKLGTKAVTTGRTRTVCGEMQTCGRGEARDELNCCCWLDPFRGPDVEYLPSRKHMRVHDHSTILLRSPSDVQTDMEESGSFGAVRQTHASSLPTRANFPYTISAVGVDAHMGRTKAIRSDFGQAYQAPVQSIFDEGAVRIDVSERMDRSLRVQHRHQTQTHTWTPGLEAKLIVTVNVNTLF